MTDHSSLQDSMIFIISLIATTNPFQILNVEIDSNPLCSLNQITGIFHIDISAVLVVKFCLSQWWCHNNGVNLCVILSPSACLY